MANNFYTTVHGANVIRRAEWAGPMCDERGEDVYLPTWNWFDASKSEEPDSAKLQA